MKSKSAILILSVLLSVAVAFSVATITTARGHLQDPPPKVEKVDQHWKVVPNVAPVDLERQLKILNEAGISVEPSEIVLVGDKFTILMSDVEGEEE